MCGRTAALDVQMPKLSGFEVVELVGRRRVIFTTRTTSTRTRVRVHAVDYLLKRSARPAAGGAREGPPANGHDSSHRVVPAVAPTRGRPALDLAHRHSDGAHVHVVAIDKVDYVEAQDDYVSVRTGARNCSRNKRSGSGAAARSERFVRIHRSYLLNLDCLDRLELAARTRGRDPSGWPATARDRTGYARLKELL